MSPTAHFGPELFAFLRDLGEHNTKAWFDANKHRYEDCVKGPALQFITELAPRLAKVSPHMRAIPKASGGSLMRIYRDTRFGKDKTPYKTNVGIQLRHEAGKDVHAPGYYLHLAPGEVFFGAGMWRPESSALRAIREAIVADPARWKKVVGAAAFKRGDLTLAGESLKRAPKGFDPEHPLIEDLRRKDVMALAELDEAAATAPGFLTAFVKHCRSTAPLMTFIADACELPF